MAIDHTAAIRLEPHDKAKWDQWFRAVYPRVYFVLYQKTGGDKELSEECTQGAIERFLRYRAYNKVTTDGRSVAYLARTALRLLANHHRSNRSLEPLCVESLENHRNQDGTEADLELDRLSQRLPEPERRLIGLLRDGCTVREVAKILKISYSATGVRIHRLKKQLRKIVTQV